MNKPRIFSGVQPSGNLHIGNYLGAMTQFVALQDEYDCIFCVVDYHAITVKQEPEKLKKNIIEIAKLFMAAGIDPKKSIIFQQSHVTAHTELSWILNTVARMSDLNKMIQFKEKAGISEADSKFLEKKKIKIADDLPDTMVLGMAKNFFEKASNVSVALFDYPVLMAADILLYDTAMVPVGDDQSQHVELTRDLARRFNHDFGEVFIEPGLKTLKQGSRIMGLDDPTKKMSKSAVSEYNRIELTDSPEIAAKKIMRAQTDTGAEIKYDAKEKPGISNLLTIYSLFVEKDIKILEKEYQGKGYGDFKKDLAEVVKEFLIKFESKYNKISDADVKKVLADGANKVRPIANKKLKDVKQVLGIL